MIDWNAEPQDDAEQIAFERAAIEAAQGYVGALKALDLAYERIAKLEAQVMALVGLERKR